VTRTLSSSMPSRLQPPAAPRLTASFVAFAFIVMSGQASAQAPSTEQQLKELQEQVNLLKEKAALISAQSELDMARAQGQFARLAGIKAGLDSVGPPPGKEGKLTVTAGTAGALLLKLKKPMFDGLDQAAVNIAQTIVAQKERLGGAVVIAADADFQAALQAAATQRSLEQAALGLSESMDAIRQSGIGTAGFLPAIAGVGLVLNTLNDFSKLFRTDRSMEVFSADAEAQQILQLLIENRLAGEKGLLVKLDDMQPQVVLDTADESQKQLLALKGLHTEATHMLAAVEKLPEQGKPDAASIEALKGAAAHARELIDALHPAHKPDAFWKYVDGRHKDKRLKDAQGKYLGRIVLNAKAQTVQVIESRTFRSDKVYGTADVQVDYRIVDGSGVLLKSELWLLTLDSQGAKEPARVWPAPAAKAIASGTPTLGAVH
jgi:hypothetical protein